MAAKEKKKEFASTKNQLKRKERDESTHPSKKRKTELPSSNWAALAKQIGVDPLKPKSTESPIAIPPPPPTLNRLEKIQEKAKIWVASPDPIPGADEKITKYLAMDCEMVGTGPDGKESILAEIAIVNSYGACIYHAHVRPTEFVTNWRTAVSGIRPKDVLQNGKDFAQVQQEVAEIIKDRIIVGHHLQHDWHVLKLSHPFKLTRDTAKYRPLTRSKAKPRALRWLCQKILGISIQKGAHSPIIDARASMLLYQAIKKEWEESISESFRKKKPKKNQSSQRKVDEESRNQK